MRMRFQSWVHRYPIVIAVSSLGVGTAVAYLTDVGFHPLWSAAMGVILITWSWRLRHGPRTLLWAAVAVAFLSLGLFQGANVLTRGTDFQPPTSRIAVHATVIGCLTRGPDVRVLLMAQGTDQLGRPSLPGRGRLVLRHCDIPLCYGDRIAFFSRIRKPTNRGNPGEYDWELYCANNSIGWQASVHGNASLVVLRRGSRLDPRALLFRLREAMAGFLDTGSGNLFSGEEEQRVRAILKGIIIGDRGGLGAKAGSGHDRSIREAFADSGLAHVLSASGLHVGIVVLMIFFGVRIAVRLTPRILLWIPLKKIVALASIPAVVIYCLLVGSRIPAMRAAMMGMVVAAAVLLDRSWNSLNSLALAALLILMAYPLSLFDPGFQLSFAAVTGILVGAVPLLERLYRGEGGLPAHTRATGNTREHRSVPRMMLRVRRYFVALTLTTVAATIAVTPFLVQTFHKVPLYSIVANIPAVLALTAALSMGIPATVIGTLNPELGSVLLMPAEFSVWCILEIASFFSSLPGSTVSLPHWGPVQFVLALGTAFAALWYVSSPDRARLGTFAGVSAATVVALLCGLWSSTHGETFTATFLNVGQADAAFVRAPGSHGVLIDGGIRNQYFDSGRSVILPFLRWAGVRSLDGVIVTHPQADHAGGVRSVLKEIRPTCLWCNLIDIPSPGHRHLLDTTRLLSIPVEPADSSCSPVALGRAQIVFLNTCRRAISGQYSSRDVNNASVVSRISYGDISFLFTGDLESEGEDELLASGCRLDATVLKVGHHGGRGASTRRFLAAVNPAVAVICAAYPSRRGLPSATVLKRLESRGVKVYWTGRDGAITMQTDGRGSLHISTGRGIRDTVLCSQRQRSEVRRLRSRRHAPLRASSIPAVPGQDSVHRDAALRGSLSGRTIFLETNVRVNASY